MPDRGTLTGRVVGVLDLQHVARLRDYTKKTKTQVYVFHHEKHNSEYGEVSTKVSKNIDKLKKDGSLGYIDTKRFLLSRSVKDISLVHPQKDIHLKEVKKVVDKLLEIL